MKLSVLSNPITMNFEMNAGRLSANVNTVNETYFFSNTHPDALRFFLPLVLFVRAQGNRLKGYISAGSLF